MHITKTGITIGHENKPHISKDTEVTIIVKCPAANFESYSLQYPLSVSFDTQEHNDFIKNIKKKYSLKISITPLTEIKGEVLSTKRIFNLAMTTIAPAPKETESRAKESEPPHRTTCKFTCYQTDMYNWKGPPNKNYFFPVSISASDFSQIKTFNQQVKKVIITTQRFPHNFISFRVNSGTSKFLEKEFGECMDNYPFLEKDDDGNKWCGDCEKYLEECECGCEICDEYKGVCTCVCPCGSQELFRECECEPNPYTIFSRSYPLAALLKLTKVTGTKLDFYEPRDSKDFLKIVFNATCQETLGQVEVLIRSADHLPEMEIKKKKASDVKRVPN